MTLAAITGRRIRLRGTVQGVGMRPWIFRLAADHGIKGHVRNEANAVVIDAFAAHQDLEAFISHLRDEPPPAADIEALDWISLESAPASEFTIAESDAGAERRVSIPPDLATCDQCAAEIVDPADRRYRYPFTNCTNCGPRFTIVTGVPYDRAATTMAGFRMCPECQREYDDPRDRRFHAQPNACPVCGPRLAAVDPDGRLRDVADPIRLAAAEIAAGRIVAVKGLGGFHLACDAASPAAVARLRERKHREEKPLAVMVRTIEEAERIAEIDAAARTLLLSAERPIVIVPRRERARGERPHGAGEHAAGCASIAEEVAPRTPLVGLMLPYTPLHHLLVADCGGPVVMTSANVSDEPIVARNDEALTRLRDIADLFLVHDRDIVARCDDSVAMVIANRPALIRRSRGFVPRSIRLAHAVETPVLGCGALLKNTFCLAYGHDAWLGPHIGDLENTDTFAAYHEAVERMERFLGFRGEILAHDLHPDYLSTHYARARAGRTTVAVQHHHAHVASAMAEHGLDGPVIGLAFDGTGYGTDGTAWGGEFLVACAGAVERVASFRPLALAGGDAAIREPWRLAVAALIDAFGPRAPIDQLAAFRSIGPSSVLVVRQMLAARLNTPLARGVGRYFDAFGALVLARTRSRYEGQVALELTMAADPAETRAYEYAIDSAGSLVEVDLRPAIRQATADILRCERAAAIAARFHNTVVSASAAVVRRIVRDRGRLPVVLTGGCFQNARLAEGLARTLASRCDVYLHQRVPPGDGGIALGQALVAGHGARKR